MFITTANPPMDVLQLGKLVTVTATVAVGALGIWFLTRPSDSPPQTIPVSVPVLSADARTGEAAFAENCAECHGVNAAGTQSGPPLVHKIYEPSHHGDGAFVSAARNGVRAHHWNFGDMPPVDGIDDDKIASIVKYIRELQRHNGIH